MDPGQDLRGRKEALGRGKSEAKQKGTLEDQAKRLPHVLEGHTNFLDRVLLVDPPDRVNQMTVELKSKASAVKARLRRYDSTTNA